MEAQWYYITDSIVNQDIQSTVLLASKEKASKGKRTKHVKIIYFFVTNRIVNKETSVEYFPIDDIHGDFFTKPTQGSLFWNFRKLILNLWT